MAKFCKIWILLTPILKTFLVVFTTEEENIIYLRILFLKFLKYGMLYNLSKAREQLFSNDWEPFFIFHQKIEFRWTELQYAWQRSSWNYWSHLTFQEYGSRNFHTSYYHQINGMTKCFHCQFNALSRTFLSLRP